MTHSKSKRNHQILFAASALILSGCSSTEEVFENMPVERLYLEAKQNLDGGNLNKAAQAFAEVERQHPYSNWALKAQLMSAYSYYLAKKYEESVESFKTFIQLHPGHEHVPYAFYMIGLCHYEQIPTIYRDQESTRQAQAAFEEVVRRFPDASYAKDARFKLDLIQDHLAGKEMEIGRYYLKEKTYAAASNRFKIVVEHYQTTSHITEALHRLVECYLGMGILDQAKASAAVLGYNYPGSSWYAESYNLLKTVAPDLITPNPQGATGPKKEPEKVQRTIETKPPSQ